MMRNGGLAMQRNIPILAICLVALTASCSLLAPPDVDEQGSVAVHFVRSNPSASRSIADVITPELAQSMAMTDSIVCKVFPPSGSNPEAVAGVAFPDTSDTVEVALTVIAQQNKRVAVELYEAGQLIHFGVDTDVDVVADKNTYVMITTAPFQVTSFTRDLQIVGHNVPFTISWNRVPGATAYRFQESSTPDFATIDWQTTVPDTFLPTTIPQGEYFFRVRAENAYSASNYSPNQFVNVYGAPTVTNVVPGEMLRDVVDTVYVYGDDLNYPGTQVDVFGRTGNIVQAWEDSLCVELLCPSGAWSDTLEVTNGFGTGRGVLRVQTIAYIMGDLINGDLTSALEYKNIIDVYGRNTNYSSLIIIPYGFIDFVNMKEFELIIVGWDTGTDASDWGGGGLGGQLRADAIDQSNASVMGIGVGGCAYFDLMGYSIGLSQAQANFQRDIYAVNTTADIYTTPNLVSIPPDRLIDIYSLDGLQLGIDISGGPIPTDITAYAADAPLSLIFPFIEQTTTKGGGDQANYLWGFQSSPLLFTGAGANIFENSVIYLFTKRSGGTVLPN